MHLHLVRPTGQLALLALLFGVAACGPGPSGSPSATPTIAPPTFAPSPTAPGTDASGLLAFPGSFGMELTPGRYSSSPPFDLFFTFAIAESGWRAGHLNGEFFDLQRFDGVPTTGLPSRMLAFGQPLTIQGTISLQVANLTPEAAVAALAGRDDLVTANVAELELFGRPSVRVDIHAPVNNTPVFAGDDGTYRQGIDLDARLVAVPIGGGLLLVLVQARPADLDAAWAQALEILGTVELPD